MTEFGCMCSVWNLSTSYSHHQAHCFCCIWPSCLKSMRKSLPWSCLSSLEFQMPQQNVHPQQMVPDQSVMVCGHGEWWPAVSNCEYVCWLVFSVFIHSCTFCSQLSITACSGILYHEYTSTYGMTRNFQVSCFLTGECWHYFLCLYTVYINNHPSLSWSNDGQALVYISFLLL